MILKEIEGSVKPIARPILNQSHKAKRIDWAQKNIEINFQDVCFTIEARATLDGHDG